MKRRPLWPQALAMCEAVATEASRSGPPVSVQEILGRSRDPAVSRARKEFARRLLLLPGMSLARCASYLGRDHTTVLYYARTAPDELAPPLIDYGCCRHEAWSAELCCCGCAHEAPPQRAVSGGRQ